jgi:SAM-dependent methyltransferase
MAETKPVPDDCGQNPLFTYKQRLYPEYLKHGNACQYIVPIAQQFCKGKGLDIGPGKWPFPKSLPIDNEEFSATNLPEGRVDYIFSSHCLEHLPNPIKTLESWREHLWSNGVLFLYLPHPDMEYWLPQNCRKHLHSWQPKEMHDILQDLGFINVICSERDLVWSYAVVGWMP